MDEITKRLNAPFKPNEIEWRIGVTNSAKTKGIAMPYITARAIQQRLDDIFGIFGWRNEFREWKTSKQLCGISIFHNGEWITKWDGADDSNMDATKGGLSGAMKRCATQWGIGRYLYKIPTQWVDIEQIGKSYKIKGKPPELPNWALPMDYQKETSKQFEDEPIISIPPVIQDIIDKFATFHVSQADLENYVHNEAFAFNDEDIDQLRVIYKRLLHGEKKEDIFYNYQKIKKNKMLAQKLEEIE